MRVTADPSGGGLRCRDGVMMSLGDLPVSEALRERHAAWCRRYEDSRFCMPEAEPTAAFDVGAFSAEGSEIARAIKAELPDRTAVHHDEAAAQRAGRDAPRSVFEYAV